MLWERLSQMGLWLASLPFFKAVFDHWNGSVNSWRFCKLNSKLKIQPWQIHTFSCFRYLRLQLIPELGATQLMDTCTGLNFLKCIYKMHEFNGKRSQSQSMLLSSVLTQGGPIVIVCLDFTLSREEWWLVVWKQPSQVNRKCCNDVKYCCGPSFVDCCNW